MCVDLGRKYRPTKDFSYFLFPVGRRGSPASNVEGELKTESEILGGTAQTSGFRFSMEFPAKKGTQKRTLHDVRGPCIIGGRVN